MRLSERKSRHLDVGQVIVFGVVSSPSLDVFACVGAAVQKRRHDLTLLLCLAFFRLGLFTEFKLISLKVL
jgi:hypothetical protein